MLAARDNVLKRFLAVVETYGDHEAVLEDGIRRTTYRELYDQALQVAAYLGTHAANDRVGLALDKSARYIATMLGCWLARKTFVPLDRNLPEVRQAFMLRDADISLTITDEMLSKQLFYGTFNSQPLPETDLQVPTDFPAYIIYTSGTTGQPKGVLVSHNGIVNLADCQAKAFGVDHTSRYLFYLSTHFDASISDMVVCLLTGATLLIETDSPIALASRLADLVAERRISHLDIPPALLKVLDAETVPDCLETVIIGGEAADLQTVRRWAGRVNLVNVYGPTEATVCTSLCRCGPDWSEPLLGQAIDRTEYAIFDDAQRLCPPGEAGELYIAGIGLALGYLNQPELTAQKFVVLDGKRFYRTGDRVIRRPNGDIRFLGRVDRQFKLRGQLVEPEGIETVLQDHPAVHRASVLKRQHPQTGRDVLIAYLQPSKGVAPVSSEALQGFLARHLAGWMVPSVLEWLEDLPLTASGKVDPQALLDRPLNLSAHDADVTSTAEAMLCEAFGKILNRDPVSAGDHFFECGGDSLAAVELLALCSQQGFDIPVEALLQSPTPRDMARNLWVPDTVEMPVDLLLADCTLPAGLSPGKTNANEIVQVLLTGGTGFLGSTLLHTLLTTSDFRVVCLVRASDQAAAFDRLRKTFSDYRRTLPPDFETRVRVVCGDVGQDYFGLSPEDYADLAKGIDAVYHCAALVNMLYPYAALKNVNLDGVRRMLSFCCTGRQKPLHYASTLSVFVATDRNTGVVTEADRLTATRLVYGGYGQVKYAAERCLLAVPPALCDVFLYRFGLLTGDTRTGLPARNDFLGMFVRGAQAFQALPVDDTDTFALDITPVDYAALAMARISLHPTRHRIFHLANPEPLKYNVLAACMKERGILHQLLPWNEWEALFNAVHSRAALSREAHVCRMGLCRFDADSYRKRRVMDLFQATGIRFDDRNTREISGLRCPPADPALIDRYLDGILSEAACP
jgi:amino acid adenylation domain-containing protein/thioester reductase-like protein